MRARRRLLLPLAAPILALAMPPPVFGDVFSYECDSDPVSAGWEVNNNYCDPDQWVDLCDTGVSMDNLCFFQHVELCEGHPPPGGQLASYRRTLDDFLGEDRFFVEWVVETDADRSEIPWGGGSALALGTNYGINYTFFIAGDQAELNRDNTLPIIFVDLDPGVPHTHRLELYGSDLYVWYIDCVIVDQGVPEGSFPSFDPRITWRAKAAWLPNTTVWDYVRYGTIPVDGSGDYDSDGFVDLDDFYYFHECLAKNGPGIFGGPALDAGPGCRFADFDGDADVDLADFAAFQCAITESR